MVSEKIIIILITLAILLSAISIVVTVSSVNSFKVPEIKINQGGTIPDNDLAIVSVGIMPPENVQENTG